MVKILIIEDDHNKLSQISKALLAVEGIESGDLTHVADIQSAKVNLKRYCFDLLILDIAIPNRIDSGIDRDGGIKLLDEIIDRDTYKVPVHIIGITAYEDIFSKTSERFSWRLLTILYYDPSSNDWSQRLQARARLIIAAKNNLESAEEYRSFLCIVCGLVTPELLSILQIPWSFKQEIVPNDETIYYRGQFNQKGTSQDVFAAAAPRMGMPAAAILTMKMISAFRPRYIAITGITAGISGRTKFGDIIVADPSWDWGCGKWEIVKNELTFMPAPHQLPLEVPLRNKMGQFALNADALSRIKQSWPGEKPEHELSLHIGPLASGASVLADGLTKTRIRQQHRELLGIEMETYGVFAATEESTSPRPSVFSMKSVVDFADGKKNDRYRKYAAYVSSQALKYFVENYL